MVAERSVCDRYNSGYEGVGLLSPRGLRASSRICHFEAELGVETLFEIVSFPVKWTPQKKRASFVACIPWPES